MGNRAKATEFVANAVEEILPGGGNKEIILNRLGEMSDNEFKDLVQAIKKGEAFIHMFVPNGAEQKISVDRNLAIAEKLNIPIFEHVWTYSPVTGRRNLSHQPRLVVPLPSRRLVQMLEYKISVAKDNKHIDQRTDQVTGISKASAVSAPEINMLLAQELTYSIREYTKYRGGDSTGMFLMDNLILRDGSVKQETLEKTGTRAKAPEVASIYLTAMHLRNNW